MANILVCDDDKEIVEAISIYLSQEGYQIFKAYNGREAIEVLQKEDIQLLLIDIMMPEMDGIHAMIKIRTFSAIPILVLSAKSEDVDKILGLNVGADDYITKPFNPLEVSARVRSQLRRYLKLGSGIAEVDTYTMGGIEMKDSSKEVTVDGNPVALTPKEYDILRFLMQNAGTVFTPAEIYRRVWDDIPLNAAGAIAVHIRHLREKLEINPAEPRYLFTEVGVGYRMAEGE